MELKLFLLLIVLSFLISACNRVVPVQPSEPSVPIEPEASVQEPPEEPSSPFEPETDLLPKLPKKLPDISPTLRTCNLDSDCVRIRADCCGCNNGGKADTLNKRYLEQYEDSVNVACDIACPRVISDDASCSAEIKCILNKCTLVR